MAKCIWLTGLSGSGKTTLSTHLAHELRSRGQLVSILDGDVVLIRKQSSADSGEIVLALLEDEATVKTFIRTQDGHGLLRAANAAYPDIPFESADCKILGVVCGLLRFRI